VVTLNGLNPNVTVMEPASTLNLIDMVTWREGAGPRNQEEGGVSL
jgi:hypothetical protein